MKMNIIVTNENKDIIFKGNPYNLPIHFDEIKKKSIELFNDDEPCIIHQSYSIQKLIDGFLEQFKGVDVHEMKFINMKDNYHFIQLENIKDLYLTIKR